MDGSTGFKNRGGRTGPGLCGGDGPPSTGSASPGIPRIAAAAESNMDLHGHRGTRNDPPYRASRTLHTCENQPTASATTPTTSRDRGQRRTGRAVPRLRRGDPQDHLHNERDRVPERQIPASRASTRALAQRRRSVDVSLPSDPDPGPHRPRQGTMGHPVEGSAQRVRDHLRRAHQPVEQLRTPDAHPPFIGQTRSPGSRHP